MIEVGEYIRLDDGTIGKYQINKNWINVVETNDKYIGFDIEKDVVKHSKNIIDLIEVGDYVNGYRVDEMHDFPNGTSRVICNKYIGERQSFTNIDIKNIVTKEQFWEVSYKVGDIEC